MDDTITINAYLGWAEGVEVPDIIDGKPVTDLARGAFNGVTSLLNISFPGTLTNISDLVFQDCSNLTNVVIPDLVTTIGSQAFISCHALESVSIGENVSSIGGWAFFECVSLRDLVIPDSVTYIGSNAFARCMSLLNINVAESNAFYCDMDGVLLNAAKTRLMQFPGGKAGRYRLPSTLTHMDSWAMAYAEGLTSITISAGVTNIGSSTFKSSVNLSGVYFQGDAPVQGGHVFDSVDDATVYVLSSAAGWPAVPGLWANRPTALWLPEVQAEGMGVQDHAFGFNIDWADGQTVVVEACTDLNDPVWMPVETNTIVDGTAPFSDSAWTNLTGRFYRFVEP